MWMTAEGRSMSETREIAAILVADVVGYSRLAGAGEVRKLSRLRGIRSDLIDRAIAAHHGRIVKRTGDASDPRITARSDNVISINATIRIDLTGACNSRHMLGHQYSASGGQLDFVRGACASKGGKSNVAATSTAAKGKISRVVARLEVPVTTPRIDTHYIVSEFGTVNLKGLSSTERPHALIAVARPEFRDGVRDAAKKQQLI
jgi:itaconate CoA-transferase